MIHVATTYSSCFVWECLGIGVFFVLMGGLFFRQVQLKSNAQPPETRGVALISLSLEDQAGTFEQVHQAGMMQAPITSWTYLSIDVQLVGGLVAIFYFPIYGVSNHPN